MIKRLAHVCLGARDLLAAERFYVEQLGMPLAFEFMRGGERIGFYVKAGAGTYIEIFADSSPEAAERPRIKHFCLEVDDLDAAIATLTERGVEVVDRKLGADNAWQAWISDPSGIRIELMQYRQDSAQFTSQAVRLD